MNVPKFIILIAFNLGFGHKLLFLLLYTCIFSFFLLETVNFDLSKSFMKKKIKRFLYATCITLSRNLLRIIICNWQRGREKKNLDFIWTLLILIIFSCCICLCTIHYTFSGSLLDINEFMKPNIILCCWKHT